MRIVTHPVDYEGRRVGTLHVADPLTPVENAEASLRRTFAVAGSLALLLAVAAGILIATLIARPLRRMATVAAAVDAGDLSQRAGSVAERGEVGALAPPSTACWSGWSAPSSASATSSPTRRTSSARRLPWCEPRSSCSTARPTNGRATRGRRRCCTASTSSTGSSVTCSPSPAPRRAAWSAPSRSTSADFFEDLRRDLPLFGEREFHVEPVDGVLEADPDRLTQVLRNLVRNAVSHTTPATE